MDSSSSPGRPRPTQRRDLRPGPGGPRRISSASAGVYSLVRHPLYVAEEIAVLGGIVINFSPLTVLLLAVHIALQIQRARNEEGVLSEAFPEYEAYKLRTRRFIPGVY